MGTSETLGDEFDRRLLKILREGRQVISREGDVQEVEASAADLNVIRQRLKDCGITAVPVEASPIGNIVAEMNKRRLRLSEMDDTDDLATAEG
ncbi:MAG: hypothetical protein VX951_08850 [Planctomycetota bacterium]|nr:hypothetical protein [Planctomycetota bacterium]|tara:strand:+ start:220 stop:498 length:279 start_codon:yes stop_codon:yes gene_type:complete